jgi:hypothetical protein
MKVKGKEYQAADRDSMYVVVRKSGAFAFPFDDRVNGRRET